MSGISDSEKKSFLDFIKEGFFAPEKTKKGNWRRSKTRTPPPIEHTLNRAFKKKHKRWVNRQNRKRAISIKVQRKLARVK